MAVGAGGVAGGAEIADRLPRADAVPDRDRKAGHVAVERRIAVAVVDDDAVAVAAVVLGQDHRARGRGHDRAAVQAVAVDVDTGVEVTGAVLAVNAGDQVLRRHRPAKGAVEVVALLLPGALLGLLLALLLLVLLDQLGDLARGLFLGLAFGLIGGLGLGDGVGQTLQCSLGFFDLL